MNSSSSSSDSDDDTFTKQKKIAKRKAKAAKREEESRLEEKKREQIEYIKRLQKERLQKQKNYEKFLFDKMNNPNKQQIVTMLVEAKQKQSERITKKNKGFLSRSSRSPRSPIQIGERQLTPTIEWWRTQMNQMSKKGGRRRTMKKK